MSAPSLSAFTKRLDWSQVATHLGVGMASASFWRGAWYVLDDVLYPDDAFKSGVASLVLGASGMAASQGLINKTGQVLWAEQAPPPQQQISNSRILRIPSLFLRMNKTAAARYGALYGIALSCVLVWRGTWVLWDVAYETLSKKKVTDALTESGVVSHAVAAAGLVGCGFFASTLAPPAAACVLRDATVFGARTTTTKKTTSVFATTRNVVQSLLHHPSSITTTTTPRPSTAMMMSTHASAAAASWQRRRNMMHSARLLQTTKRFPVTSTKF